MCPRALHGRREGVFCAGLSTCLSRPAQRVTPLPVATCSISQIYAIRQALAKSIVSFYQKFVDETSKNEIKVSPPAAPGISPPSFRWYMRALRPYPRACGFSGLGIDHSGRDGRRLLTLLP